MIGIVSWLASYLVHSTLLLSGAAVASRYVRNDAWRDSLWKAALFGGLLTASLPGLFRYEPAAGSYSPSEWGHVGGVVPAATIAGAPGPNNPAPPEAPALQNAPSPAATVGNPVRAEAGNRDWLSWIFGAYLAGVSLLLARLVVDHFRLYRALGQRVSLAEGKSARVLTKLRRQAGHWKPIRLTTSEACPTPIALGLSEICVPPRFATDLRSDEQEAALAHEVAHLVRRDPLWQLVAAITEAAFFFQPLNRIARRRMRECAENLADDWAVRYTGSPMGLARCLTEVSSWIGRAAIPTRTLAIAEGGSPLLSRVERLAAWKDLPVPPRTARSTAVVSALALLSAIAPVAVPGESASRAGATSGDRDAVTPDTIIRHPDPDAPLADRWQWAMTDRSGPTWIAWATEHDIDPLISIASSAGNVPGVPGAEVDDLLNDLEGRTNLLVVAAGVSVETSRGDPFGWQMGRVTDAIRIEGTLVWLGSADVRSSLDLLDRLYGVTTQPSIRADIIAAMVIHGGGEEAVSTLRRVLTNDIDVDVRSEAIQWLARRPALGSVPLLEASAWSDSSRAVRAEAVDGLASLLAFDAEGAERALHRIADEHPQLDLRSEAIQALAAHDEDRRTQ